jgi:hypothetical protein
MAWQPPVLVGSALQHVAVGCSLPGDAGAGSKSSVQTTSTSPRALHGHAVTLLWGCPFCSMCSPA